MKTIEEKTKVYDEAICNNYKSFNELIERLESVKDAIKKQNYGIAMDILCKHYPEFQITASTELEESDEWIKNEIIAFVEQSIHRGGGTPIPQEQENKWIAWLEKRESVGEIVERCKTSWYNEGKIQGQIEGLSDEEKYQQGWHDALEKQARLVDEYEDKLDRCACESFNKGYKAAIEHKKEKLAEWSKEDMDIINGIITDYEGEIEHLSDSAIDEQAKPIYQERINFLNRLKSLYLVKQEWSEEDDNKINSIKYLLHELDNHNFDNWLKSIKDKVQPQPKQEWSEEDIEMLNSAISFVKHSAFTTIGKGKNNVIAWLKSLKERIGNV